MNSGLVKSDMGEGISGSTSESIGGKTLKGDEQFGSRKAVSI